MKTDHILEIERGLRRGAYSDEASVSTGIVMRILQSLGWDIFDPEQIKREYKVGDGRVDYALFHPPTQPFAFIEVKREGNIENADKQLFRYMFDQGVPLAVVTDGRIWRFYLPTEKGNASSREFAKFEIGSDAPDDISGELRTFLGYEQVREGSAERSARERHAENYRKEQTRQLLPFLWEKLTVEDSTELANALSSLFEKQFNKKPDVREITEFLYNDLTLKTKPSTAPTGNKRPEPDSTGGRKIGNETRPIAKGLHERSRDRVSKGTQTYVAKITYRSEVKETRGNTEALVWLLRRFAEIDSEFLVRFENNRPSRMKRSIIARDPNKLYPSEHLSDKSLEFLEGWYIATNNATRDVKRYIELACKTFGVRYGDDVYVEVRERGK